MVIPPVGKVRDFILSRTKWNHLDFRVASTVRGGHRRVGHPERQVEHPVVAYTQDPKPDRACRHGQGGVSNAVDRRGVHERLGRAGYVRHPGHERRFPGGVAAVLAGGRQAVWIVNGPVNQAGEGRPEPRAVVPSSHCVCAGGVVRILVCHVDMGEPEIPEAAVLDRIPGGILGRQLNRTGHEGLVLDDQGKLIGTERVGDHKAAGVDASAVGAVDQVLFRRVRYNVACRHSRIHVETGDPGGMVMIEHQSCAQLVGIKERQRPRARIVRRPRGPGRHGGMAHRVEPHVRNVRHAGALGFGCGFSCRGIPLKNGSVTDPRRGGAVEMGRGAVLGIHFGIAVTRVGRNVPCAHVGGVDGNKEVASGAGGKFIFVQDPHGYVPCGYDHGTEIGRRLLHPVYDFDVAPQLGRREVGMQLLGVFNRPDFVAVRIRA